MSGENELQPINPEAYAILTQFFDYDRSIPLDARVYDRVELPYSHRETVVLRGIGIDRVPGYLSIPKAGSPPYACVLVLHGLGASREDWWTATSVDEELRLGLESTGFAVLALDLPFHGQRSLESDHQSIWTLVVDQACINTYRQMLVKGVLEHRRALDYLVTRADIDGTRFGVMGRSVGGLVTYILAAVEGRLKTAIVNSTCPMGDYYVESAGWEATAKQQLAPVAPRNFAPAITDIPFLMLNGKQDPYGREADIRSLYELVGSTEKDLVLFDSGHRLPSAYVPTAVEWFVRHLG